MIIIFAQLKKDTRFSYQYMSNKFLELADYLNFGMSKEDIWVFIKAQKMKEEKFLNENSAIKDKNMN